MNGRWDKLQVDSNEMLGYTTVPPPGEGPFPGVLICMHAPNRNTFDDVRSWTLTLKRWFGG